MGQRGSLGVHTRSQSLQVVDSGHASTIYHLNLLSKVRADGLNGGSPAGHTMVRPVRIMKAFTVVLNSGSEDCAEK